MLPYTSMLFSIFNGLKSVTFTKNDQFCDLISFPRHTHCLKKTESSNKMYGLLVNLCCRILKIIKNK